MRTFRLRPQLAALALLLLGCGPANPEGTRPGQGFPLSNEGTNLVREYVSRDTAGGRLRHDPWFLNVSAWEDEPGWDRFMLVSDITFSQLSADSSTARVRVRATRVGYLAQTASGQLAFSADQGVDEYVATAVLMDNGWRLAAPQQMPRVSLTATLQDAPLHDDARRALELKLTERRP